MIYDTMSTRQLTGVNDMKSPTREEYNKLLQDLEAQTESVYRVSYAIRCLDVLDGEKEQLTDDGETISPDYRQPLVDANLISADEIYLDQLWLPESVEKFLPHIWGPDLYSDHFTLWEMIICGVGYND